jgi:hypothetical protein
MTTDRFGLCLEAELARDIKLEDFLRNIPNGDDEVEKDILNLILKLK